MHFVYNYRGHICIHYISPSICTNIHLQSICTLQIFFNLEVFFMVYWSFTDLILCLFLLFICLLILGWRVYWVFGIVVCNFCMLVCREVSILEFVRFHAYLCVSLEWFYDSCLYDLWSHSLLFKYGYQAFLGTVMTRDKSYTKGVTLRLMFYHHQQLARI